MFLEDANSDKCKTALLSKYQGGTVIFNMSILDQYWDY